MIGRAVLSAMAFALIVLAAIAAHAETLVERGRYLVDTVMTCHNCHTPRGPNGPMFDKALSGGLRFNEPGFDVTASNITPDKETGIGAWSDAELKTFMTTGVRPNGVAVAVVMPTAFYKIMTERDLDAVGAYLKTIPPVKNQVPEPIYKMALHPPSVPNADKPMTETDLDDKVKRGFYLATIAHCMECHSPLGPRGRDFSKLGAGGFEFKGPWGVSVSRNITSHKDKGLGAWSDDEIKRAITQGVSRDGSRLKPPMGYPYYAKMTASDLDAMVAYLRTVPPQE